MTERRVLRHAVLRLLEAKGVEGRTPAARDRLDGSIVLRDRVLERNELLNAKLLCRGRGAGR